MTQPEPRLYSEPLLAWRAWAVVPSERLTLIGGSSGRRPLGHLLCSVSWQDPWPARKRVTATCGFGAQADDGFAFHVAPELECQCGIYAFKAQGQAEELVARTLKELRDRRATQVTYAVGRISIWGRIIETERGYRAQYAYPYDVIILGGTEEQAHQIRAFYAVDVELRGTPGSLDEGQAEQAV